MMKRKSMKVLIAVTLALVLTLSLIPTSLAYTVLRYRDEGAEVMTMQKALASKGYYSGKIDGIFMGGTWKAVKAFQRASGLKVDGCAGNLTLSALYGTTPPPTPTPDPDDGVTKPKSASTLYYTCMGARVTTLQKALTKLGYYSGAIDGVFGEGTVKAVKAFQSAHGLHADGMVGTKTAAKINSKQSTYKLTLASTLVIDSTGDEVKALQKKLTSLGYYAGGDKEGVLGVNTINAVNAFQDYVGLSRTDSVSKSMYNRIINYTGLISPYTTLRKGAKGTQVAALNAKLVSLGYAAPTGDEYTDATIAAVKAFQAAYGLDADGVAGPKTRAKLDTL